MYRSFLSWRYLLHRKTNLIGIVGIFVGVGALILILSIMTGFLEQSRKTVRGSLSDLILTPTALPGKPTRLPREPDRILTAIRDNPMVAAASPHLNWYGMIGLTGARAQQSGEVMSDALHGDLSAVQLVGIDPEDEFATTELYEALTREPRWGSLVADPDDPFAPPPSYDPDNDPERPRPRASVIVGEQLYDWYKLRRGEFIRILTAVPNPDTGEFESYSREFVVAGTFRSGENEMDMDRIYFERSELADFLGPDRSYSEILIKLHDYERDGRNAKDALFETLATEKKLIDEYPYQIRTWEQHRQVLLKAIGNERVLMGIMLSLVLVVAGFTVFAILSMMVTEKRRDVGILTALGATPRGVMTTFLMIAFWDALLGATAGCVFGTWAALKIDAIEQGLSSFFGIQIFDRNVYLFDHIPSVVEPWRVAVIVFGAFVCALAFAALPAWKAARLDPLEALRYE